MAIAPGPAVVLREEFDDWAVLFNADTGEAAGINPTGVAIWKLLDGRRGVAEIAAALREQADGVPEGVEAEVEAFVAMLAEGGFLADETNPPAPLSQRGEKP